MSSLVSKIEKEAKSIRDKILKKQKPSMRFPLRSLSNVRFDQKAGYFEMGRKTKERTLAVASVKTFAQSLKMAALSKQLIETDDIATKREAYYVAKGWAEEMRFGEQDESDSVLDDIEALFRVNREQLGFVPEEKGGEVAGNLVVIDQDSDTGEQLEIDCTKFGSGAYSIPISVEHLDFSLKGQVRTRHRDGGDVPTPGEAQLLAYGGVYSRLDGRSPNAGRRGGSSGVCQTS